MDPQDDSQRRHDIIKSIQKLDSDASFLNQQKQQLLRELKSIRIVEHSGFQESKAAAWLFLLLKNWARRVRMQSTAATL